MNNQPYVIFELNQSRYGIGASAVQELFFLPEVSPVAEAPPSIVGVINLRGEILPVVDLPQRLRLKALPYQLTDSMIVLQERSERIGIIVNQICEVKSIAVDDIQPSLMGGRSPELELPLVTGIVNVEDAIITLLNPEALLHQAVATSETLPVVEQRVNLYTHLSPDAQQTLRERADNLRRSLDTQDSAGLIPLAVMGLAGEYLGLGLKAVYEFTDIHKVASIPCCPPHILGNMNLRGEIVTLVDISAAINLSNSQGIKQKAIVVRMDELTVGIAVDEIFDVMYLDPSQIAAAPVAIPAANDEYLQGIAPYRDKMMSIIDLHRLLRSDVLVVNEEV